ncbi:MAG TPA: DUF945 family protein [Steroidobacteraceae bacterium]|nr:DUF945 family protein [Steroidobacteraceae bacterium]
MKKLVIIVVVLAAVLLVAPFGIGKVAEKRLNADLDKFVEQVPYFKITERTWSGGWFKSTQTVTLELSDELGKLMGDQAEGQVGANEEAEAAAAMDAEGTQMTPVADQEEAAPEEAAAAAEDSAGDAGSDDAAAAGRAMAEAAKGFRFTVRNDVLHGPVLGAAGVGLARVDTHVELSDEVSKKIEEVFGTAKPAFEMRTRVGFFGGGTTTFKSEGRKLNVKNKNVDFTYDTFKMSVGFSRNADSYDIGGGLPRIEVRDSGDGTHFTLQDLSLDGEGKRVRGDLYDGDFAIQVKEVKIEGKGGTESVVLQDAHYIVDQKTKDDFVNMAAKFGTGAVQSDDLKKINLEVKEINYDFSLRHLHAPTLEKIMTGVKAGYTMSLTDPSKVEQAVFGPMKEHVGELLQHDPEFGIDRIGLVTPEGEIVARGVIKFVGATPEDFSAPGGMALIGKVDADITIEAAQKVLEKIPNGATMAGGAIDSGYAKRDGDKLVCHITFKAGELLINGKPQAIPGLGGPPPGAVSDGAGEDSGTTPQE